MHRQDAELEGLFFQISNLEAEYSRAIAETDYCREQMNNEWNSLHELQERYRELKELADEEFREASYCWEMDDRAGAKEHSENGKDFNEQRDYIRLSLDMAHGRYDPMKAAFDRAKANQAEVLDRLKAARAAKNRRLDELKEENAREAMHWHEKDCKSCGAKIRYRDDWSHIPNYCKECKEKFDAEKQRKEQLRREKPCKACGSTIVYYEDWNHIPNYCKECKANFTKNRGMSAVKGDVLKGSDQYKLRFNPKKGKNDFLFGTDHPKRGDGHGHVVILSDGTTRYVRDQYDPNKKGDRQQAISFNDGIWV